jgi:hypothetical protein
MESKGAILAQEAEGERLDDSKLRDTDPREQVDEGHSKQRPI